MIATSFETIVLEMGGDLRGPVTDKIIESVCIDSRGASPKTIFFALPGQRTDGHHFLQDAFRNGAAAAVVSKTMLDSITVNADWPLIVVSSPLRSLQLLAKWYRHMAFSKVLAITGSNGKTIVKDALKAIFAGQGIVASPGSYNSQLGLPLAVLSGDKQGTMAILEVGISKPGEMAILEDIISPDFGVLTNIGMAHFESFGSREAIAQEKMFLFNQIAEEGWVLLPANESSIIELVKQLRCKIEFVGSDRQRLSLSPISLVEDGHLLRLSVSDHNTSYDIHVKTRSREIISDLHFAAYAAHLLGVSLEDIASAFDQYHPSPTRMELWSSPGGIRIINDTHSADPISVHAALRTAALSAPQAEKKIFAFAGMRELGTYSEKEHFQVGVQAGECGFTHLFLVGNGNNKSTSDGYMTKQPNGSVVTVNNPDELKNYLAPLLRSGDIVLFKGPRNWGMDRAARELLGNIAQRCLWIDLAAIEGNLATFHRHCDGNVKIIAMLKALAYGTELVDLAFWMARLGIHQIGVSSTSEGIAVRKTGVEQDIFIFLPYSDEVDSLLRYHLTPIVYSVELFAAFSEALKETDSILDVHLKVNTGMNRLGVEPEIALDVARRIRASGTMRLTGICTHFAAADDPKHDDLTREQIFVFDRVLEQLRADGFDGLQIHAANTSATVRFPRAHYNTVRIGIGLYGIYPSEAVQQAINLRLAIGLTSRISSIKDYPIGSTIGYGRSYTAEHNLRAGVVNFGYDDGLPWRPDGGGHVLVEGNVAKILGRVSMDQVMVDISNLDGVDIGSEVLIYGSHGGHVLRPEDVAKQAGTIPYELLVRIGKRVHRIFLEP